MFWYSSISIGMVVLAGKGHETYQVVGAETLPLDERQVVREHLSQ